MEVIARNYSMVPLFQNVLGGIGSIPGAMVGGYLIGLLETMVSFFGYSPYRDGVVYFLLFIILIVLPAGLFGKNVRESVGEEDAKIS